MKPLFFLFFVQKISKHSICELKLYFCLLVSLYFRYRVREIHLFNTIADDVWGNRTYLNNSVLLPLPLQNVTRSKSHTHNLKMYVSQDTTNDQLFEVKKR